MGFDHYCEWLDARGYMASTGCPTTRRCARLERPERARGSRRSSAA
jgi:hypothetical protein